MNLGMNQGIPPQMNNGMGFPQGQMDQMNQGGNPMPVNQGMNPPGSGGQNPLGNLDLSALGSVSYTHLDVYKRQSWWWISTRTTGASVGIYSPLGGR